MTGEDELDAGWDEDENNGASANADGLDDAWDDDVDEEALDEGWSEAGEGGAPASRGAASLLAAVDSSLDAAWEDAASEQPARWQPYRKKRRTKKRGRVARAGADADIALQAPQPASAGVKALRKAQRSEQASGAEADPSARRGRRSDARRER